MFDIPAMGMRLPRLPTAVSALNLKRNNLDLASGSPPDRGTGGDTLTVNFTPLPKMASSVSFFFPEPRSILGA